jgi:cell wall-associated NlpC family hydrolase
MAMKNSFFFCQLLLSFTIILLAGCADAQNKPSQLIADDTPINVPAIVDSIQDNPTEEKLLPAIVAVKTGTLHPDSLVAFARTLIGIPYLYASTNPAKGFDCSGFITYVFNYVGMKVPRSSVDFTNYGKAISIEKARPGDLILFTGTNSSTRIVGHMGIVESIKNDTLYFIHSTSGKMKGVVITPFGNYYRSRFVKVIRVFADELFR